MSEARTNPEPWLLIDARTGELFPLNPAALQRGSGPTSALRHGNVGSIVVDRDRGALPGLPDCLDVL